MAGRNNDCQARDAVVANSGDRKLRFPFFAAMASSTSKKPSLTPHLVDHTSFGPCVGLNVYCFNPQDVEPYQRERPNSP